jgi:hypothetical protein
VNTFSSDTRIHPAAGTRNEREYLRLAEALAGWPGLVAQLLRDHGEVGICSGCTTRGGRNVIMAPCPVRSLAMYAQASVELRPPRGGCAATRDGRCTAEMAASAVGSCGEPR